MNSNFNREEKTRKNKRSDIRTIYGITLIALVITIIVLLILAGVSIAMLTGQNGILNQANRAKQETEKAKNEEKADLINQEIYIDVNTNPIKPGEIATDRNRGYKDKEGKIAVIPKGFKVSNIEGENDIETGLVVIAPDESEFVWIPVETVISDIESNGTTNKAMVIQDGENYRGLLYDFTSSGSTVKSGCTTTTNRFREPDIVSNYDNNMEYLGIINTILGTSLANLEDFKTYLQTEYKDMIESVKKYKGFYVGRYETSLNGNTVQPKKNVISVSAISGNTWYGLYAKQRTYNTESVQGQMIWGSQYDAMLNWAIQGKDKNKVTENTNGNHSRSAVNTGITETDKINNIYDLEGNLEEWSVEVHDINARVTRRRIFE